MTDNIVLVTQAYRSDKSKHGSGEAFDIRIKNIIGFKGFVYNKKAAEWAQKMRNKLGPDYDVVYGDSEHLDHIHCEYDPKEKLSIKLAKNN